MKSPAPVSLNVIRVQTPCPADWEQMHGDDRVRFCDECKLHVYNLSSLTRGQAEKLVAQHEGRLCVRYYQRADGTIITQDCGGGLRRAMQRTRRLVTAVASALLCAMLAPWGLGSHIRSDRSCEPKPNSDTVDALMGKPAAPREIKGEAVLGDVAPVAVQGGICPAPAPVPIMGIVAPSTRPSTQPTTKPAD